MKILHLRDGVIHNLATQDLSFLSGLTQLTYLDLSDNSISDISFLSNLTQLTSLDLHQNSISDISVLSNLTQLNSLNLNYNNVSDISCLSNLTQLTILGLNRNKISDISFLSSLTQLTSLGLRNNSISDILCLSSLTQLRLLDLYHNSISDISFLSSLTQLTILDLGNNSISDISFLSNLTELTKLYLDVNSISDISFLSSLTQLTILELRRNSISDISCLSSLTQLTELYLGVNKISDISFLSSLTQLTKLYLRDNSISDISFLSSLTQLTKLYLRDNSISDISCLSSLTQLTILDLGNNSISDISCLSSLTQLRLLDLGNNSISDISCLSSLTQLRLLDLGNNSISDISCLSNLTQLTKLYLRNNSISDISCLSSLTQLTILDLDNNSISDISCLSNLTQLTILELRRNSISDISCLSSLTQLTKLYLRDNSISDISCLSNLTQLTKLYLDNNSISDISFLSNLTQLISLELNDNNISDSKILEKIINRNKSLKFLNVSSNPLPLPINCLNSIEQLRAYYKDGDRGTTANRMIKLLFVGDSCVGKSTLLAHIKTLCPPDAIAPNERTEGIQLDTWKDYYPNHSINVWDFGGQDVLHSTHRLFLGERALYILVWCKKENKKCTKEEAHPLSYWLDFMADYGRKSIVILVENVINDEYSDELPDEKQLQALVQHYKSKEIELAPSHHLIDCLNDTDAVIEFKDTVKNKIRQLQTKFPIEDYPANWYNFQQKLEEVKKEEKTITLDEYYKLAEPFNLSNPEALLSYFNDTGVLGYFENIDNLVVLQVGWVLDAIYAGLKLKDNPLTSTGGKLRHKHFDLMWQDYPEKDRALFLAYMLQSNLLAEPYIYQQERAYTYLLPALFPEMKARDRFNWEKESGYVVLKFKFAFTAIMHQLQVRILAHCHFEDEETLCRNYISFTDWENNDAYVEMLKEEKELRIYSESQKLTQTILNEINKIYPLDRVQLLERKRGIADTEFRFNNDEKYLLDTKMETHQADNTRKKTIENKVFVTYSWTDEHGNFDEGHQNRVGRFVDQLRKEWGFDASFDLYEEEANFIKMMYKKLYSSHKVIIVLSEGYTAKANAFKNSGVETEYIAIMNDIKKHPKKYILVAFDSRDDAKFPYGLQGNDTILLKGDLVCEDLPAEQNRLLAKLKGESLVDVPGVAKKMPEVKKKSF